MSLSRVHRHRRRASTLISVASAADPHSAAARNANRPRAGALGARTRRVSVVQHVTSAVLAWSPVRHVPTSHTIPCLNFASAMAMRTPWPSTREPNRACAWPRARAWSGGRAARRGASDASEPPAALALYAVAALGLAMSLPCRCRGRVGAASFGGTMATASCHFLAAWDLSRQRLASAGRRLTRPKPQRGRTCGAPFKCILGHPRPQADVLMTCAPVSGRGGWCRGRGRRHQGIGTQNYAATLRTFPTQRRHWRF